MLNLLKLKTIFLAASLALTSQLQALSIENPYHSFADVAEELQGHIAGRSSGINIKYLEQFYGSPKVIADDGSLDLLIEGCLAEFQINDKGAITAFSVPTYEPACHFNLFGANHNAAFEQFSELTLKDVLQAFSYDEIGRTSYFSTPCTICGNAFEPFTTYHYSGPHVLGFMQMEFRISQPSYYEFEGDSDDAKQLDKFVLEYGLEEQVYQITVGRDVFLFREDEL